MSYIYDIFLNFNKEIIDFYDWNSDDIVYHIRKVPIFKISTENIYDFYCNKVKLESGFLELIENKTEVFMDRELIRIPFCSLFTDGNTVLALKLDDRGIACEKSVLLIPEELEVIDFCERMNVFNIKYEVLKEENMVEFKTRYEKNLYNYLNNQLQLLDKKNDMAKLKYLYYECFNSKEIDKNKIVKTLIDYLNNDWDNAKVKLNNFFKLATKLRGERV